MDNVDLILGDMGDEVGGLAMAVVIVTLGTEILKRNFPLVDARYFSIALSLSCGLIYALSVTFIPEEMLKAVSTFALLAFTFATAIYKLQKKK